MVPEWFNNNKQFWEMQKRLFDTYRGEMDRETRNCDLRAKRQVEWRRKLVQLKKALELAPRCTKIDPKEETLKRSAIVVEALPPDSDLKELEEDDRRLATAALLDHALLLIDSGNAKRMQEGMTHAERVEKLLEDSETKDKDPALAFSRYLSAR
eukprot:1102943-Rhodomonas_salina.1